MPRDSGVSRARNAEKAEVDMGIGVEVSMVTARRRDFIDYLASDRLGNAFALYDLQEEADRVRCWAASKENSFVGYLLLWYGMMSPHAILRGSREAVYSLLPEAPKDGCTFLVDPVCSGCVEDTREVTARLMMDLMVATEESARLVTDQGVRRLTVEDGASMTLLYDELGRGGDRDFGAWIERGIAFGVYDGERLVSVGGTHLQSEDLCFIGGVYTASDHRRRGYAARVTSAVTKKALEQVPTVSLLVVSANRAAIRLYRKLGYRKVSEWVWMDVGTGRNPLM
ncbi:MAG: GNAT family N-acetyltransferase [Candidatus Thermoplasmatota archaeon]|nr:GNAT family N-acetyltransferase [Candidatus Thermoplasmatota archaeon]